MFDVASVASYILSCAALAACATHAASFIATSPLLLALSLL